MGRTMSVAPGTMRAMPGKRWTLEELESLRPGATRALRGEDARRAVPPRPQAGGHPHLPAQPQAGRRAPGRAARARVHHPGVMNATERRYAAHLQALKDAGVILDFAFEPLKLRLGPDWKTAYTPDFLVVRADAVMELHEVKGHWEDDARVKVKVAARLHPFVFVAVTRKKGAWVREVFPPGEECA